MARWLAVDWPRIKRKARRRHAAHYTRLLSGGATVTPVQPEYASPVWHLYVIRCADRDRVRAGLDRRGIATGIHYPLPLHLQPAFEELGYSAGDFPVAERLASEVLSLPMYAELTPELVEQVATAVGELAA